MQKFLLVFLCLASQFFVAGQSATGSWYGKADVTASGSGNNYLTELILKQKGDEVEGIFGYYFKDSYQSFFVRGSYDKGSREIHIKKIPILFHRSETRNGIECPMNFLGVLLVSQVKSTVNGVFYSDEKYKYTCPELRVTFRMDESEGNQDSILQNTSALKKFWKPHEEDFVVTSGGQEKTVVLTGDTTTAAEKPVISPAAEKTLVDNLERRTNIYSKDIEVSGDSVRVSFYDNGDIDGDIISVFLNKTPVLAKQPITERSLNIYLALDSTREYNEITMMAENLGQYPPNTALMVVTDGKNRYEIYLSSSLTQNAAVRLKRKKPSGQ